MVTNATKNYSDFAQYYDQIMGDRASDIDKITEIVRQYKPDAMNILEIGTGTGTVLQGLEQHGFQAWGLDLSEEMISIAKKKMPGAWLSVQDMTEFSFDRVFDVVICIFDTINHLTSFDEWKAVFSRVWRFLEPSGIFVFDMNTLSKLENLSRSKPMVRRSGSMTSIMTVKKVADGIFNWQTEISDGVNASIRDEIKEASFPIADVLSSLKNIYSDVVVMDWTNGDISQLTGRALFVCRK